VSTRSTIWIENEDGLEGIYCHFDGYLSNNGVLLYNHYKDEEKLRELISKGEMRVLNETVEKSGFYDDGRGNYKAKDIKETAEYSEEYNYIFKDGDWFYYEDEDYQNLQRLSPALI